MRTASQAKPALVRNAQASTRKAPSIKHQPKAKRYYFDVGLGSACLSGIDTGGAYCLLEVSLAPGCCTAIVMVGVAGPLRSEYRPAEPGNRARRRTVAPGATAANPSRSRPDHSVGFCVGAGHPGSLSLWQAGGQLSGAHSLRGLELG